MTFIVPFEGEFFGNPVTIYSVNSHNPSNASRRSVTLCVPCRVCDAEHYFRVFDQPKEIKQQQGYIIEVYDCKCPECHNEFPLEVENHGGF